MRKVDKNRALNALRASADQSSEQGATSAVEDQFSQFEEAIGVTTGSLDGNVPFGPFHLEDLHATALDDQISGFDFPSAFTSLSSLENLARTWDDATTQIVPHNLRPAKLTSFSWAHLDPYAKSRIGYAMEQFRLAPQTVIQLISTPWSHSALYNEHMPRSMQDAQASCALYNAKNDVNADFVIRHITDRVEELLAAPMPTAPVDVAAHAHALILYQVMFVFDGHITLHSHVEALLLHLEKVGSALLELCKNEADPMGPLSLYPSITAQNAWRSFILRETLRRTVLSLYQFLATCYLLLSRQETCAPSLARGNKVTLSAHLWRAKSAFDFAMAWNSKKHFVVHDLDFTEVLRDAQPDDIDDFAKTMLVGLQGTDDVKGWFHARGGVF